MKKNLVILGLILIVFVSGMVVQYIWFGSSSKKASSEREILYWVAPMDPNFRRDEPGKSPMGMDLVPVYADDQSADQDVVTISSAVENNLSVKTSTVKREDVPRIIDTVGYVTADENNIEHINAYTDGWIKAMHVKTTGEVVKKGQLLLELYSRPLVSAQEEFLLAKKNNNLTLIQAGEKKLLTLGMSEQQVAKLRKTGTVIEDLKVYATQSGIVSQLNVREGMYLKPDTIIMVIEDLSVIWMIAEVFERQASWVKVGDPVVATLPYLPGKVWQGKVDYVYPHLDPTTHTLKVRLVFPNPDLTIKPNMYSSIKILSPAATNALTIPRSAIIRSSRGNRVILALGEGRYRAQMIETLFESDSRVVVKSGLDEGDVVVTSAQFLIDSESNLNASFARMMDESPEDTPSPQEYVAMGKVNSVDKAKRTVSIHHQPIPELDMPTMTMDLPVSEEVDLALVKAGDSIHFVLIQKGKNQYLITMIHVMPESDEE